MLLAPSKRRASLYTLPLVVVIGFLSVAGLAAWQRSDVIADLADQVARGEKAEATAAVRKLAAIPSPPLSILVEAATSDEHATAEAAQVAINRMLGKWQKQVDKKERLNAVANQLTELAAALAAQRQDFPRADFPWLAGATRRILRIAAGCPPKKTPLVAMHCDEIMAVIGDTEALAKPFAGTMHPDDTTASKNPTPPAEFDNRDAQKIELEQEFSEFPTQAMPAELKPAAQEPAADNATLQQQPQSDVELPVQAPNQAGTLRKPIEPSSNQPPLDPAPAPADSAAKSTWKQPVFRILPAMPIHAAAPQIQPGDARGSSPIPIRADADHSAQSTRQLLTSWFDAGSNDRAPIEHELAARGFKHLSTRLIKQYLSSDFAERSRVVDTALTEPNIDARPWLLLLAEDESADVRLLAVTVMATSDDKVLVEKAWEAAVQDHDPRVADLAGRLRARRTGTTRR